MKNSFNMLYQPKFEDPSLIVGWENDVGGLASRVIQCINNKINGKSFCEIEPLSFFSLGGIEIENDVAKFPQNRFFAAEKGDIIIFAGREPELNHYQFLEIILCIAQHQCKIKELYTISGTISSIPFNNPRKIYTVYNNIQFQKELTDYGLLNMTWEGPPATNSLLLWMAKMKGIRGISIWPEIPFYLASVDDYKAQKSVLEFFNKRLHLGIDLIEIDDAIARQSIDIAQLRKQDSEINQYMELIEMNVPLSQEDHINLTKKVTEFFLGR